MATVPGRLHVRPDGRVAGPAQIEYNDPFPTKNGSWGSGAINGVVMHTMVGNLPGTIELFNTDRGADSASAHFGIGQQGHIHQFGPIGKGWIAWAQVAGNEAWYSIEHADNGDTHNPLTDAQITASAQLVEVLSRFAGFPLQVTDSVDGRGYGVHNMGGLAWGGHTCPGPGPRAGQRDAIIELAKQIRHQHGTATTWQAKALAQATALGTELTALQAMLQPGDALTKAKAIQADASALADLIKEHQ
jgi:hypothetical protein